MSQPQFERREDGVYEGETKIASVSDTGFRMIKGHGDRKEEVHEFLGQEEESETPFPVAPFQQMSAEEIVGIAKGAALSSMVKTRDPICPIKGHMTMGDKDPEVIKWWYSNHPHLAEKKYGHRRCEKPTSAIDV